MKHEEFQHRVKHNTQVLRRALDNNENLVSIADKFYTWENAPGELHFSILMRNLHDIIPCAYLGALANTKGNGADGFAVKLNNDIECLEVKTSEVASTRVWKGEKGGLYTGIGSDRRQSNALTSAMSAKYVCHTKSNLKSKNMRTILFITDTDDIMCTHSYIDAWELCGSTIMKYLRLTENKKRSIKFGSFLLRGFKAKTTVPLVGFDAFKAKLQEIAPERDDWLENYKQQKMQG